MREASESIYPLRYFKEEILLAMFYLRKNIVYVPKMAKETSGIYSHIDPVLVVSASDEAGLKNALQKMIREGNPSTPNKPRENINDSVILKHAGVKTFSAFAQGTLVWIVEDLSGFYKILPQKKGKPRGWVNDRERTVEFPPGTAVDEVCNRLASMIQAAAGVA